MIPRHALPALFSVLIAFTAAPALADAIDGDWCAADGRHMTIHGPDIVTPQGHKLAGAYTRHSFSYQVPTGEPNAGATLEMLLANEFTVRVKAPAGEEIWKRCSAVVS